MNQTFSRVSLLTGTILLTTAALAGCGGNDTTDPAASPTGPTATPSSVDPSSITAPPTTGKDSSQTGGPRSVTVSALGDTELKIVVRANPSASPTTKTLTCNPVGGTVSDTAAACKQLAAAGGVAALQPQPLAGRSCTQQIAGPAVATITGTVQGKQVSVQLRQNDGCRIAQWNSLSTLLGSRAGAT